MTIEIDDSPLLTNLMLGLIIFILLSGSFYAGFLMSEKIYQNKCDDYIENYLNVTCQECFKDQYYVPNVTIPVNYYPNNTIHLTECGPVAVTIPPK